MYFDFINLNKLSRNFLQQPITLKEMIAYEDFYYVYIELNLTKGECAKFFGCGVSKIQKCIRTYNLSKDTKTIAKSQQQYLLRTRGVTNCMQLPEVAKKCHDAFKETMKENKLDISNKRRETCKRKYGVDNPSKSDTIKQKKKETCYNHYKVNSPLQNEDIKTKFRNTYKEKYIEFPFNKNSTLHESTKNTIMEKYNVDNAMKNKKVADKTSKTLKRRLEEYKQKNLEKYGKEFTSQLQWVKDKINHTKTYNHSHNRSNEEEIIAQKLSTKFRIERHYSSRDYIYACDFYLPDLDLYIEYNGHWTHGGAPFDKNNKKCLELLKIMQERSKNSKYYKQAIYTWTDLDVRKRELAKKNNLNYLMFYSMKEFDEWFEKF